MTQYRYRAQDHSGEPVEGLMEEATAHKVRTRLQERGLTVLLVEETEKSEGLLRISPRLTWQEIQTFTDQLRGIVKYGLPLPASLAAMSRDISSARLRKVLDQMRRDLEQGRSLEESIERQHGAFPRLYAPLIRAGEASGNLPGVLQLLAEHADAQLSTRNALKVGLAYPATVLVCAALVIWFVLTRVVTIFAAIFAEFGGELPAPTRFWIWMSEVILRNESFILLSLAGLMLFLVALRVLAARWDPARYWLDAMRLRLPLLGHVYYLLSVARFARTLGLLLASRVPILDSLELAAAASGSPSVERAVEEASLGVAGGDRIADALARTRFFPHNFCWLLGTGEGRGEVEHALEAYADTAEREAGVRDRTVMAMFTPALVLLVGFVIVSIIFALYLPIFTLGDQISGT